jgi:hypothetical protein
MGNELKNKKQKSDGSKPKYAKIESKQAVDEMG